MLVREYRESDLAQLRAIHAAQGFEYALPDLGNPLFMTKLVLEGKNAAPSRPAQTGSSPASFDEGEPGVDAALKGGATKTPTLTREEKCEVVGAALLRLTAEAYLLLDPRAGTPRERWNWLLALHAAAERDAWQRGLEDVHAWLPPPIAGKFGKRLARLGWIRDDAWTPYCKRLEVSG
jgi:hypothetical protein